MATIASLVVKIGADVSELKTNVAKATDILDKAGISFGKLVSAQVAADAVTSTLKAGYAAFTGELSASVKAAAEAEKSHKQLVTALERQGNATPDVVSAYSRYALELQRTTMFQDDAAKARPSYSRLSAT